VTGELDDAVGRGLSVVPLCPYVRRIISEDRERYLDLVPEGVRHRLGLSPGRD
jgi:predicted GNAT family acetyltransferase